MDLAKYQTHDNAFDHLSLSDLLDARDLYHAFLTQHPRVNATAIGRYRIRVRDSWPGQQAQRHGREVRTLANSEVRLYSWPSVLVFVDEWVAPSDVSAGQDELVPTALNMPDGRRVPVCVIEAPRDPLIGATPEPVRHPLNNIGSGSPILSDAQGRQHVATVACLVTDGHEIYALTNRHVAGDADTVIRAELGGKVTEIGRTTPRQLTRMPFSEVYPAFPARDTWVNLDLALVDIDDLDRWSAGVPDLGIVGPAADFSDENLSLGLIGAQVRGHGATSGTMLGEVAGLFYRYRTQGGSEFVADLFIGPRPRRNGNKAVPLATHPGDSGTLWLLEPLRQNGNHVTSTEFLPLAVQWGEARVSDPAGSEQPYALATMLGRAFEKLQVDLVRDWNLDNPDTWGAVGHFSIASRAAKSLRRVPTLKALMANNLEIISHRDATIQAADFTGMGSAEFVPMADVPDFYWKHGTQGYSRGGEGPNHFADMDQPRPSDNKTLLELCDDPAWLDPAKWISFYDSVEDLLEHKPIAAAHRGLLPFRVWQIFDALVDYARRGRRKEFVCAAGILAHYVGDACQPLHISYLHDGDPLQPQTKTVHHIKKDTYEEVKYALGTGVHSAYEDQMVNAYSAKILSGLDAVPAVTVAELITTGAEAGAATVDLMRTTFRRLPPLKILNGYLAYTGRPKDRAPYMWKKFGPATIACMTKGTHLLSVLWQSAWTQGNGENTVTSTAALTQTEAMKLCQDPSFLPSYTIDKIASALQ